MSLYNILKGKAYHMATVAAGRTNTDAQAEGFDDVFDLIMSDSNNTRQAVFLAMLPHDLEEGHRKILLDGLAEEYAEVDGWMAYIDRECAT